MQLMDMLPPRHQNSKYTVDVQQAFTRQTEKLLQSKNDVFLQLNVKSATWGLELWERALDISIEKDKPLAFRRSRIESKLRSQGVTTKAMIKNAAESFSNGLVEIIEHPEIYRFDVKFVGAIGNPPNMEDLTAMIEEIKPAHLAYQYIYTFVTNRQISRFTHVKLAQFTHTQIRNGEGLDLD